MHIKRRRTKTVVCKKCIDACAAMPAIYRFYGGTMIKVSVVVPVYNVEDYLDEAMESLVRQTLKEMEFICINDGSTDSSLNILKKYAQKDERVIVIDKKNEGYGVGMNIGLEKARGEYIGILEPDDFAALNMFEDLYSVAQSNDLDFVKADFYRFSRNEENGNMQLEYNHLDPSGENYGQVIDPYEKPYITRFIMNTWSGIYRRQFIEEHHIRHNTTPGASFQDNGFFWQTFIYAKRCMFVDKPYYMNRRDNPNSSVNSKEKVYCMNVEYDHIYDIFMQKENRQLWERYKYFFTLKKFHNYVFTLTRISDSFKKEFVERFGKEMKRARDREELDMSLFTVLEQEKLNLLMNDSYGYYLKYGLYEGRSASERFYAAENELRKIKSSRSYKIGRKITWLPRKIIKRKNAAALKEKE